MSSDGMAVSRSWRHAWMTLSMCWKRQRSCLYCASALACCFSVSLSSGVNMPGLVMFGNSGSLGGGSLVASWSSAAGGGVG